MLNEEWKDIKGYEGIYQISNFGRVKNINLFKSPKSIKKYKRLRQNKILKAGITSKGYLNVNLCKNKITTSLLIHRLVAQHFIPNPDNKPCVNHDDGDKQNNNVSNLEWCTHSENNIHAIKKGLTNYNNDYKKKKVKITKGNFSKTFNSMKDCSIYLDCHFSNIGKCIKNNHKCKDYIISYV